jgi:hypothetical protein
MWLSATAADLFGFQPSRAAALDPLERELGDLESGPPLWLISPQAWSAIITSVRSFADRWGQPAADSGWTREQLYGLAPRACMARYDLMGAA